MTNTIENTNELIELSSQAQWFILTAIGGKEESIIEALKEKVHNFGYDKYVGEIRIFKTKQLVEKTFKKDDEDFPKNLKDTASVKWEVQPNGSYKRIRTSIVNKYPGYVFINMIMDRDVWYAIRNTPGVLGFVGSSGKGASPIPISIDEYLYASGEGDKVEASESTAVLEAGEHIEEATNESPVYTTNIKVGYNVEILASQFAGDIGIVRSINLKEGKAKVELDMFGRVTEVEFSLNEIKIED
ncbi:MAG: transcription termination/antitermination protein NusG [Mycoplasmataceae bacterium]|nr:transcription termination/antitermination protein NusG [Mycoplasmataceae bacterium]